MTPTSTVTTTLSIKQQRVTQREKYRQLEKRHIRNRRTTWAIGIVATGPQPHW